MSNELTAPFTGATFDELARLYMFLTEDNPLPLDVLDCVLSEYSKTNDINTAIMFDCSEWDL